MNFASQSGTSPTPLITRSVSLEFFNWYWFFSPLVSSSLWSCIQNKQLLCLWVHWRWHLWRINSKRCRALNRLACVQALCWACDMFRALMEKCRKSTLFARSYWSVCCFTLSFFPPSPSWLHEYAQTFLFQETYWTLHLIPHSLTLCSHRYWC